jgi:hypothetical protein
MIITFFLRSDVLNIFEEKKLKRLEKSKENKILTFDGNKIL